MDVLDALHCSENVLEPWVSAWVVLEVPFSGEVVSASLAICCGGVFDGSVGLVVGADACTSFMSTVVADGHVATEANFLDCRGFVA